VVIDEDPVRIGLARAAVGSLGEVHHVRGDFTFVLGPGQQDNYRWDPAQGGGALLDVGIYAIGAAVALWGAEPDAVTATALPSVTGIDATTSVWCDWGGGRTASALVSFELPECQRLELVGTTARIVVGGPAFTGGAAATTYERHSVKGDIEVVASVADDPYLAMVEAFARAVRGIEPWPRPASESVALARLLDRVRAASA
jgi:D-xylose 1-dehydrogenase (NADP+, D-xylono-1,5-lactone-forming)